MKLEGRVPRVRGIQFIRFAAMVCTLAAFCGCGVNNGGSSCGTEVPDPTELVFGCVEKVTGEPAVGVRVTAVPKSGGLSGAGTHTSDTMGAVVWKEVTTVTNYLGRFTFEKPLTPGNYDLFFEDTAIDMKKERPLQRFVDARVSVSEPNKIKLIKMSAPRELIVQVKDLGTGNLETGAVCKVLYTPYQDTTNELGIVTFFLPKGDYQVECKGSDTQWLRRSITVGDADVVESFGVFITDSRNLSLDPPENLTVEYDTLTGVARMSWSKVENAQLKTYGIRRVDVALGGGPYELATTATTHADNPYALKTDSVQMKDLLYCVYSIRIENLYEVGSPKIRILAPRPLANGPRIDSIYALAPDSTYQPGDTARIVAVWRNLFRGNDTLYWREKGTTQTLAGTSRPAGSGSDTLLYVVPKSGPVEIGLTLRDTDGYRSWRSRAFRFGLP